MISAHFLKMCFSFCYIIVFVTFYFINCLLVFIVFFVILSLWANTLSRCHTHSRSTLLGALYECYRTGLTLLSEQPQFFTTWILWDSVPCSHDTIASFLHVCQRHLHANLPFSHIPKVFYWIWIRWLRRPRKNIELTVLFMKPVWDYFCFVTWCIIMLEVAIRRWVHCGHEGMHMVSNNTQIGCAIHVMIDWY